VTGAIDGHQHFWDPARLPLPWLKPEHAPIDRAFLPRDLEPLLEDCGIEQTILVQSANLDADTDFMFELAAQHDWIAAVVAWLPLDDPARAAQRLDELGAQPKLRGIRHLIHDEDDPHWIVRPAVQAGLALLEERGLILELPAVYPRHLGDVPELATRFPRLQLVIDHLGKPPLGSDLRPWAELLRAAAAHPTVAAKVSGLNTATPKTDWAADDLREAVEIALDAFGSDRLLSGSDWPVALLNGDYVRVWRETRRAIGEIAPELDATARRLYRL
jgi:L-fuconolactonase